MFSPSFAISFAGAQRADREGPSPRSPNGGGVSSRIFRMLNDLAIEAIEKGEERITDNAVETYKPVSENEVAFQ